MDTVDSKGIRDALDNGWSNLSELPTLSPQEFVSRPSPDPDNKTGRTEFSLRPPYWNSTFTD